MVERSFGNFADESHTTKRCLRWVTSDKTHIEHNETALILIADMPRDMDFCCNGPMAEVVIRASGALGDERPKPENASVDSLGPPGRFVERALTTAAARSPAAADRVRAVELVPITMP